MLPNTLNVKTNNATTAGSKNQTETVTSSLADQRRMSPRQTSETSKGTASDPKPPTKITASTKKKALEESRASVMTPENAAMWFVDKGYIPAGETITISSIQVALFWMAGGDITSWTEMITGIRAASICLEVVGKMAGLDRAAAEVQMKDVVDKVVGEAQKEMGKVTAEAVKKIQETTAEETLTTEDRKKIEEERTMKIIDTLQNQQQSLTQSYADTLKKATQTSAATRPPPTGPARGQREMEPTVIAREERQNRLFMVDGAVGAESATANLTPNVIVTKANLALESIEETTDWSAENSLLRPSKTAFVAAQKIANGGTVLEINTREAADWLRQPAISKEFEQKFGGSVTLKSRNFMAIVEYIPVRAKHSLEGSERKIEEANGLEVGAIEKIRWMRRPETWDGDQEKAHAILQTRSHRIANEILKGGLIVEGERKRARKLEDDPRRCYRCQIMEPGHTTKNCKSPMEVCAKCAGRHATSTCKVPKQSYKCASCIEHNTDHNHAAWDRKCPVFLEERERIRTRRPENRYRYYPHPDEAWTWELFDEGRDGTRRWMGNQEERRHIAGLYQNIRDKGYGNTLGNGRPAGYNRGLNGGGYGSRGGYDTGRYMQGGYPPYNRSAQHQGLYQRTDTVLTGGNTEPTAGPSRPQGTPPSSQQMLLTSQDRGRSTSRRGRAGDSRPGSQTRQTQLPATWLTEDPGQPQTSNST